MNQLRFPSALLGAAMALFLTSCGGREEKTTTAGSDTTTTTAPTTTTTTSTAPSSTVVTTPQNMMIARHKVANFEKWKASYDAHDSLRTANGVHSYVIGRCVDDPNMVLVAVKADDMAKAKALAKDPALKKAMQEGGVVGAPTFNFPIMVYQDTAKIGSDIRSMATFTVKDWDTWKNKFDSGKQVRIENGLMDRAYGYDADDKHKVTVVVAVMDTAKAYAFWKSDLLKQRRAESGVTGPTQRFVFHVVQRY